jgi:hypothetical protein
MRLAAALMLAVASARPQTWSEVLGRSESGIVALRQALIDVRSDQLALLVASHPDDRYLTLAPLLRYRFGCRVAVLLATRGGGGQNSRGPETGDALERIRTLESEAGAVPFDAPIYYLNRTDAGYRRTADETFAEWGREETLRLLVNVIRGVRPDIVATTHHAEESHGHDLALVELLPLAIAQSTDPAVVTDRRPHRVHWLFLGASGSPAPSALRFSLDEVDPLRGTTYRRLAYDVLRRCHQSSGDPGPMHTVYEPDVFFTPALPDGRAQPRELFDGVPCLFDAALWPGARDSATRLRELLARGLPEVANDRARLIELAVAALVELRALECVAGSETDRRRWLRVEALERLIRHANNVVLDVSTAPGTTAVPGEELALAVDIHVGGPQPVTAIAAESLSGGTVELTAPGTSELSVAAGGSLRLEATVHVPIAAGGTDDPMGDRFRSDRFDPPVRLRFDCRLAGVVIPVVVTVPLELRNAAELRVVPRGLLLPTARKEVQFTVEVQRNTRFPVAGTIEVRAPAGYVTVGDRRDVLLDSVRGDSFSFALRAPEARKSGVDVLRIAMGKNHVVLPIHKIDVQIDSALRIGLVLGSDDTLPAVIGIGGFGLQWSELTDADLAVRDLDAFDTIVVDIRALRDRPDARRSFRRLLEFCQLRGKRLVVFYHKDVEFHPPGEGFRGAPFTPFQIGRARVTRADAPVRILAPDHVLLNHPNAIRLSDWDGWAQERALYLPSVLADQYEQLLEMNDPGQPPERSALLHARCGEGEYVYCALALWRQLKKLHPGGVRLLANLLTPSAGRS